MVFSTAIFARGNGSSVHVNGYTRSNGTYVQGHQRSAPNNSVDDNYSTKGNINPYTGIKGTKIYKNNYKPAYSNSLKNPKVAKSKKRTTRKVRKKRNRGV